MKSNDLLSVITDCNKVMVLEESEFPEGLIPESNKKSDAMFGLESPKAYKQIYCGSRTNCNVCQKEVVNIYHGDFGSYTSDKAFAGDHTQYAIGETNGYIIILK